MNAIVMNTDLGSGDRAAATLRNAARIWFVVAAIGQLMLVAYVVLFYGGAAVKGDFLGWNKVLAHGYVPGDTVGNIVLGAHLLIAAVITLGGLLQLMPQVRTHAPTFHRWNGRVYITVAFITSLAGIYMVWFRGAVGDVTQHVTVTLNGMLIMVCAALAWRFAAARDFRTHRRWALRLFLAVSGVWFFRVGLMFWIAVNQGPAGFDPKTFTGPALNVLGFTVYLLPLAVLELYLRAQERGSAAARVAVAGLIGVVTIAMAIGILVAAKGMWLPRMM